MSTNSTDSKPQSLEARATDAIAGLVPWLAPIPSAVLVANATMNHLAWSLPVAIVAGLIIEGLGLTSTSTALTLWDWNARRPKGEPRAPFWLAGLMVAVYLVSTIGLTVVLDMDVALVHIAPALFPVLALVGTINIALRSQHKHRLERIAQAEQLARDEALKAEQERKADEERRRLERKADREARRQAKLPGVSNEVSNDRSIDTYSDKGVQSRREKYESNLTALLDAYRDNRELGPSEAARMFDVTRQTIDNWRDELEKRGLIHQNGNGLEVLG
jgi:hypothetical protein